jgi:AmmeMemoRadiSam system protein B
MHHRVARLFLFILIFKALMACSLEIKEQATMRPLADTIGFAHRDWQMDSVMARLDRFVSEDHVGKNFHFQGIPRVLISPHDDYAYVGSLYPAALRNIRAKTIILFGVAHKARLLGLEDLVIFDSYDFWQGPYGKVKVSPVREAIIKEMPQAFYQVNDSMQKIEHSIEAIVPFLQYYNRDVQIVSILVPYMSFERIQEIAGLLSRAIKKATIDKGLNWGKDFAIIISTDAVHYGDEGWGGSNFARYGTDSAGYLQAMFHEYEIMNNLAGNLDLLKIRAFCDSTVMEDDYRKYKWTWCGRYSVPMGLATAFTMNELLGKEPLVGSIIGYATSIDHETLSVEDLGMGTTAPASMHHWVGYAALGYR